MEMFSFVDLWVALLPQSKLAQALHCTESLPEVITLQSSFVQATDFHVKSTNSGLESKCHS